MALCPAGVSPLSVFLTRGTFLIIRVKQVFPALSEAGALVSQTLALECMCFVEVQVVITQVFPSLSLATVTREIYSPQYPDLETGY